MKIRQVSVFIENQSGRMADVIEFLAKNNINIRALSLADTSDFGILRLIVNKPDEAFKLLKEADFTAGITDVIAVSVPDKPGGLSEVLCTLKNYNISVEYMYAYVEHGTDLAVMIFRFEDIDKTLEVMQKENMQILTGDMLYNI